MFTALSSVQKARRVGPVLETCVAHSDCQWAVEVYWRLVWSGKLCQSETV